MTIFTKVLTNTDVENRLSVPETCLKDLPPLEGGHAVNLRVKDHESGDVWTFQCSIRAGALKPFILSGWREFAKSKKLQMGDMVKFCWELDQAAGAQYKIQVKRSNSTSGEGKEAYRCHLTTGDKYRTAAGLCSEQPRKTSGHKHLPPTDFPMKFNYSVPRSSMGLKIGRASNSQPQQPQPSYNGPYHMQEPQQSTSQPSQAGANIGNAAGHSHSMAPTDCAMRCCNVCVPRYRVDPMVVNSSQMHPQQPPHSHGQSYDSQQPQASFDQHQHSQLPATVNIGSVGHSHLSNMDSAMRGCRCALRCSVCTVSDNVIQQQQVQVGPSQSQPQQPPKSHSQPYHSQQPTWKKKSPHGRGPSKLCYLWDMDDGERRFVPINNLGQPVGPESAKFSSCLGFIAQDGHMAPLTFVDWKEMPDANKENMWQYVQTKFDIDPRCKSWVFNSLARKFSSWKARLKVSHYDPHKTDEERLKDLDPRVVPDQWPILVAYWNSEKEKANRAKFKGASHAIGRKSFARIREEERAKRPDGKELSRAEVYILTHTRKDGQPVDEYAAEAIAAQTD